MNPSVDYVSHVNFYHVIHQKDKWNKGWKQRGGLLSRRQIRMYI